MAAKVTVGLGLFALLVFLAIPVSGQDYLIGPEDVLEVRVHGNEDLSLTVAISLEGAISLPLIGKVVTSGLTARQLELKLSQLYADGFLKDPQVSIFIKEYKSKKVYVLGAVNKPGTYALTKETTVVEMISAAQGVTEEAGMDLILVRPVGRKAEGPITPEKAKQEEITLVDLQALLDGNLKNNMLVQDGDTILISNKLDKAIFVLGQVRKPGKYPLGRNPSVIEMISKAEGVTDDAGLEVMIVRPSQDHKREEPITPQQARREEITVLDLKALLDGDMRQNMLLKNGDTVFVSHKLDKKVYVLGQVNQPGKYPLARNSTLIDMISKAGGVTEKAGLDLMLIRPRNSRNVQGPVAPEEASKEEISVLDLRTLLDGDARSNLPVQDGDTVFIPDALRKKVYVVGAVKKPGTIPLGKDSTVIEMLSRAEGVSEEAGEEVIVIRPQSKREKEGPLTPEEAKTGELTMVDLRAVQEGDLSKNIRVKDGDTVYVPRAEVFYVMGEVKKPGRYKLERGTTVLKAISTAGGLTEKANPRRTKVLREVGGVKKEFRVGLNSPVEPQDTVIVPESFF